MLHLCLFNCMMLSFSVLLKYMSSPMKKGNDINILSMSKEIASTLWRYANLTNTALVENRIAPANEYRIPRYVGDCFRILF